MKTIRCFDEVILTFITTSIRRFMTIFVTQTVPVDVSNLLFFGH